MDSLKKNTKEQLADLLLENGVPAEVAQAFEGKIADSEACRHRQLG